jgi:hypothetical protein
MKTACLLALAGITCLLTGAGAWSQNFNQQCGSYVAVCGYYNCYHVTGNCANGTRYFRLKQESLIGGGCMESPGSTCNWQSHDCIDQGLTADCSKVLCTSKRTITYCQ